MNKNITYKNNPKNENSWLQNREFSSENINNDTLNVLFKKRDLLDYAENDDDIQYDAFKSPYLLYEHKKERLLILPDTVNRFELFGY